MSALVERIIAARDGITGLNISDYALIREAREAMAEAANALDNYAKTVALIEKIDNRVVAHLMWLDERGRNSTSYGSHADAYEIAARRLREAMGRSEKEAEKTSSDSGPNFSDIADDGPTAA